MSRNPSNIGTLKYGISVVCGQRRWAVRDGAFDPEAAGGLRGHGVKSTGGVEFCPGFTPPGPRDQGPHVRVVISRHRAGEELTRQSVLNGMYKRLPRNYHKKLNRLREQMESLMDWMHCPFEDHVRQSQHRTRVSDKICRHALEMASGPKLSIFPSLSKGHRHFAVL